jgi:hypothetical protein
MFWDIPPLGAGPASVEFLDHQIVDSTEIEKENDLQEIGSDRKAQMRRCY